MFGHTWHENDVPLVTVSVKSVCINFYLLISQLILLDITCADIFLFFWNASRLYSTMTLPLSFWFEDTMCDEMIEIASEQYVITE